MTLVMPAIVWMVGGIVAWLAGRYHLTVDQQQLVSTDIIGGISFGGSMIAGLWLHLRAYQATPPKEGK